MQKSDLKSSVMEYNLSPYLKTNKSLQNQQLSNVLRRPRADTTPVRKETKTIPFGSNWNNCYSPKTDLKCSNFIEDAPVKETKSLQLNSPESNRYSPKISDLNLQHRGIKLKEKGSINNDLRDVSIKKVVTSPPRLNSPENNSKTTSDQRRTVKLKEEGFIRRFVLLNESNFNFAVKYPNQFPPDAVADLLQIIMERVIKGFLSYEIGAKLCISIVEKDKKQIIFASFVNICEQWYEKHDRIFRDIKTGDNTHRFTVFMQFLSEFYERLKHQQQKYQTEITRLLSVLVKFCQICVDLPIVRREKVENLFNVLTIIGKDLQLECPMLLKELLTSVRDGFITTTGDMDIRRKLLQIIELHASSWQLSESSIMYYQHEQDEYVL